MCTGMLVDGLLAHFDLSVRMSSGSVLNYEGADDIALLDVVDGWMLMFLGGEL